MAGVITRSAFSKALWEGINSWYGDAYDEHPVEWKGLFDTYSSGKAFEEDVNISGFGLAAVKPEGVAVAYDSMTQGWTTRYTHTEYGLGFVITNLMVADDQYMVVGQKKARALAFSMRQTKEVVAHNVYNRAFNSTYTGGDGLELLSTAHLNVASGTWQNELTNAQDLSEAALEEACIEISKWTNDRGLQINVRPQSLHIPTDLEFEANRILNSPLRVGTAENDLNALRYLSKFPGGIHTHHYFTDTDAWFIRNKCDDGMKYFERQGDEFAEDNEFETKNLKYQATARYSFGWSDPRDVFGSPGA